MTDLLCGTVMKPCLRKSHDSDVLAPPCFPPTVRVEQNRTPVQPRFSSLFLLLQILLYDCVAAHHFLCVNAMAALCLIPTQAGHCQQCCSDDSECCIRRYECHNPLCPVSCSALLCHDQSPSCYTDCLCFLISVLDIYCFNTQSQKRA